MPVHPVPLRTDIAAPIDDRARRALRLLAAAFFALWLASAPMAVRAASALSDASVTPTDGTTATLFTFSVHYASTGSPAQPAQSVWADVAGATVALTKVSGSAHDGTWQGTATLPAGTWQVTFNATSSDPPAPLAGPVVTVIDPPPPTPEPTVAPPPPATPRPPTPRPAPQPPPPPAPDDPTEAPTSPSAIPSRSSSPSPSPTASPRRTADESDEPTATPEPTDPAAEDTSAPGSMFASLLIVGGTMSLAGAAVLARHWYVARGARPH